MSFRDLSIFNVALLMKQGWRLMENPGSLIVRLLKAKYYKNSNILKASLGANPSLLWKNIWCAKGLLIFELKWRIGSGSSVSIWQDYWLPGKDNCFISTSRVEGLEKVSDLMLQNLNRWNRTLIYSTFAMEETHQIVRLPIPSTTQSDKIVTYNG